MRGETELRGLLPGGGGDTGQQDSVSRRQVSELLVSTRDLEMKMGRKERMKRKVPTFKQEGIYHQFLHNEEISKWATEKVNSTDDIKTEPMILKQGQTS